MKDPNVPLLPDTRHFLELPYDKGFIKVDLNADANDQWVVELLDRDGEFISGWQIDIPPFLKDCLPPKP